MPTNTERFLERATVGLATDPELRLDVQAELRSHIEDKLAELGGDEHADEAVASLGDVVELAEEVSEANQRRLGWRNLARRILRFGLVPVSIVSAFVFLDYSLVLGIRHVRSLGADDRAGRFLDLFTWLPDRRTPKRSEHDSLVLNGDLTRPSSERRRTLWERNPTNRVYYADYITYLIAAHPSHEHFLAELAHAKTVDPDNGRYPLLSAMARAEIAAEWAPAIVAERQNLPRAYPFKQPIDRPALDRAMADLLVATAMPEYHYYQRDILRERLAVIGPPTCLLDALTRTAVAWSSIILPDLSRARRAGRYSLAYAQLLIDEGRPEEAVPFLGIPEILSRAIARDSISLIEMLVSSALTQNARQTVPEILRKIGRGTEAVATEKRLTAIQAPRQKLRDSYKQPSAELDRLVAQRASWFANVALSGLGWRSVTALATKLRNACRLEFVALTQTMVSLLCLLLLAAMFACLVVSLRWWYLLGSQAAPLLLLPSGRDLVRILLLGVVAPFVVFLIWTRFIPFSGHAYGPGYAWHRVLAELLVLATTLLLLPGWLATKAFRRRCVDLDLAMPPRLPWVLRSLLVVAGALLVAGFLVPLDARESVRTGSRLAVSGGLLMALGVFVIAIRSLLAARAHGQVVGTLSRSLIPVFAAATVLLSAVVQPLLRAQERRLLRADEFLFSGDELAVSGMEAELVERLRKETLKAMAENPMPAIPTTKPQP